VLVDDVKFNVWPGFMVDLTWRPTRSLQSGVECSSTCDNVLGSVDARHVRDAFHLSNECTLPEWLHGRAVWTLVMFSASSRLRARSDDVGDCCTVVEEST
jgi:hypothetical protein